MNIFVGNLSFEAREADVHQLFSAFGKVLTVTVIMEKKGDKSRGFGFVEMADEAESLAAIAELHDKELLGRPIHVMPALPKKPRKERPVVVHSEPEKEFQAKPDFKRTGEHRKGRRSLSFIKKHAQAGIPVAPKKEYKANPMRWRKKKPWERFSGESRSWDKAKGEAKPWEKANKGEAAKPWDKTKGEAAKPWEKKQGAVKPWKKAKGESKWKKSSPGGKPWNKPKKVAKHWEKHLKAAKPSENS